VALIVKIADYQHNGQDTELRLSSDKAKQQNHQAHGLKKS
jgi:hypothetical protein